MNPNKVYSSASAAHIKRLQEHSPIGARETLLSKRSPKNFLALVLCQIGALLCLAGPSFSLTIDSVVPSKGKVTVNWSGGTAPYQLEKSTDFKTWEPVDTETSATSLASIQTSPNAFYRVRNGSSGGGATGGSKTDTTAPSVPTGVSAANNSCSQVTVSWTASTDSGRNATGVKGYYVYRDGVFLRAVLAPATLTSDVGLSASTTYTYTVRAYDGATNFSGYSTPVTTTTPVCADNSPPSVPSGVAAVSSSCSQIDITWSPSTDNTGGSGLQSYNVYRNNAFWKQVLAPATSTSDTGLAAATTVSYTVTAIDKAGNQSALSPASTATTPSCGDTTAPSVPAGLIVTATSCSQINLSWAASTDNTGGTGVGSYYIYRDGIYLKAVVGGTATADAGLTASTSHSYAVTAIDNAGNQSAKSAALSATTPACADTSAPSVPVGVTATAASTNQINLSWSPSLDNPGGTGVQGYYVYRNGAYVGFTGTPSYSSSGLAVGTQYCFTITALDNSGNQSAFSVQACSTTQTPACTYSLSSSSASALASGSSSSITVNAGAGCAWTATSGAAWLTCTASGTGTGTLSWTAAANTGTSSRSGTITVQGQTFTVTQAGAACTYTLSSFGASVVATGGSGSVNVTAGAGCTWSASSSDTTWLTITGASGNGSGSVSYSVAANTGTAARTGTLIIAAQVFTVSQAGAACTYSLSSSSASAPASGSSSSITVNAGTGCSWTPTSNAAWLTSTSSGTGTGTLTWTAAANTTTASRSGTITVQGQTFTVTQAGAACTYTLASFGASVVATGGSGSVNVTAGAGCTWSASSSDTTWLTITGASGNGSGSVSYSVAANTGAARTGTLIIAAQVFTVSQAGAACTYTLSSSSASVVATGGSGSVNVTAGVGCTWSAGSSDTTWLTITGASGNGSGSVSYSAAANTSTAARNGTLTIGGQVFTVSQAGAACTYSLSSASASAPASGTTSSVTVNAGSGCTWTPTSNAGWLTCTPSGTGTGTLTWTAAANTGTSSRTGTITVQGQTFTVTQPGVACTYNLSSTTISIGSIATVGSVNVTAGSTCSWIASSSASWLSITAGFSGTGNGSVTYAAVANLLTSSRTGTLTIAGQTFTVTQAGVLGDSTPPTVSLTSPTSGSTVSGTVNIMANASDNVGVTRVDFYCDGTMLLGSVTSAPFTYPCDTTRIANGSRTFHCQAFDAAGNTTSTPMIPVTVNNTVQSSGPWAKRFGSTGADFGNVVAVDASGNTYVAGCFQGTVDFGGGPLTSAGDYDVFVAQYSSSGVHQWSKRFGGATRDTVNCIALDNGGNVIIGGVLAGGSLMKISSQGVLQWAKGPATGATGVAVDSQGNVIITGSFSASTDFGDNHVIASAYSSVDAYLAKYSSAGTCLWAKDFANSGDVEAGIAVAVDKRTNPLTGQPYDNIVLAGWAYTDINLGGAHFINASWGGFGFIGKFTPAGDHIWSSTIGLKTAANDPTAWVKIVGMALDSNGDLAISGQFNVQANLGAATVYAVAAISEGFVGKYSGADGHYLWAQPLTGGNDCAPLGIAVDSQNNIIVAGYYYITVNFGGQSLTSNGSVADCFVAKYSTSGGNTWARSYGGANSDGAYGVAVDGAGSPVVTGYMQDTGTWSGTSLTSAGSFDCFLMKINP